MGFDKKAQAFLNNKASKDSIDATSGLMSAQDLASSFEQARGGSLTQSYVGNEGAGIGRFQKSKYDTDLDTSRLESVSQEELGYDRAEAQSTGDLLLEGMKNFGAEAVLGTAEGLTRLLDLPEIGAVFTGETTNYSNFAADYISKLKEDLSGEVYSARDENFLSGSFWAKNAGTMASTITIMVPGMVATKGLSMLGKSLGAGNKILKLAKVLKMDPSKVLANANMLGQTLITRHIESQMEAMGTVASMKQQLDSGEITNGIYELQDGSVIDLSKQKASDLTEDQKNEIAGEAGRNNYIANAPMMLQDFVQLSAISKMLKVSKGSKAAVSSMKRLEKDLTNSKGLRRWAMGLGELGGVGISEGLEEGYQNVTNAWAMQNTMAKHGLANYESLGGTIDRATAEDGFTEAVVLGAFGGVLFGGGGKVANQIKGGNRDKIKNIETQMAMAKVADKAYNDTVKQSLLNPNLKDVNTYGNIIANVSNSVSQGNLERGIRDAEDILSKTDEEIIIGNEDIKDVKEYRKNLTEYVSILQDANEEMRVHMADNSMRQYAAGRLYGTSKKVQTKIDEARATLTKEFVTKDTTKLSPEERTIYNEDKASYLKEQQDAKKTIAKFADSYDNAIEDLAIKKALNASLTNKMANRLHKETSKELRDISSKLVADSKYDKDGITKVVDGTIKAFNKASKHLEKTIKDSKKLGKELNEKEIGKVFNSEFDRILNPILEKSSTDGFNAKKAYQDEIYAGLNLGSKEGAILSGFNIMDGFKDSTTKESDRVLDLFKTQEGREILRDEAARSMDKVKTDKLEDSQPLFEQAIDEIELEKAFSSTFGEGFLGDKKVRANYYKHRKRINSPEVSEDAPAINAVPNVKTTKEVTEIPEREINTVPEVVETESELSVGKVVFKTNRFTENRDEKGLFETIPSEDKIGVASLVNHSAASNPTLGKTGKQLKGSSEGTITIDSFKGQKVGLLKDSVGNTISVITQNSNNTSLFSTLESKKSLKVTYTKENFSSDIIKVLGLETPLMDLGGNNLPLVDGKPTIFIGNFYAATKDNVSTTSMLMYSADGKMKTVDITDSMKDVVGSTWMLTVAPSGKEIPLAVTTKTAGKVMYNNKTVAEHVYDTIEKVTVVLNKEFTDKIKDLTKEGSTEKEAIKSLLGSGKGEKIIAPTIMFEYKGSMMPWSAYSFAKSKDTKELNDLIKFDSNNKSGSYFQLVATSPKKDVDGNYVVPKIQYNRKRTIEEGLGEPIRENVIGKEEIMKVLDSRYMLINPDAIRDNADTIIKDWLHVNIVPGGDIYADPTFNVKITDSKVAETIGIKKTPVTSTVVTPSNTKATVVTQNRDTAIALQNALASLISTPGNNFLKEVSGLKGYDSVYKKYNEAIKTKSLEDALFDSGLDQVIINAMRDSVLPKTISEDIVETLFSKELRDIASTRQQFTGDSVPAMLVGMLSNMPITFGLVQEGIIETTSLYSIINNTIQEGLAIVAISDIGTVVKKGLPYSGVNGLLESTEKFFQKEIAINPLNPSGLINIFSSTSEIEVKTPEIIKEDKPIVPVTKEVVTDTTTETIAEPGLLEKFTIKKKTTKVEDTKETPAEAGLLSKFKVKKETVEVETIKEKITKTLFDEVIVNDKKVYNNLDVFGDVDFKLFEDSLFDSYQTTDIEWFKKVLPNVPIMLLESLSEMSIKYGTKALGVFDNNMVAIVNGAMPKVVRHEAFHTVFNMYLNERQQKTLLLEAKKYAAKGESLTEFLADAYMNYVKPVGKSRKGISSMIRNFFRELLGYLSNRSSMTEVFEAIDKGYFANAKTSKQILDSKIDMTTLAKDSFESIDVLRESLTEEGKQKLNQMLKSGELEIKCE